MNKRTLLLPYILIILTAIMQPAVSQNDLSIYHLQSIPQSSYSNPALMPECKVHVGIPALSSLYFGFGNGGFNVNDVFYNRPDDSVGINLNKVVDGLGKRNYLSFKAQVEVISFGFKVKQNYFNFSTTEKVSFRFGYPKDFMSLLWRGNAQFIGGEADFKGLGVNHIHYREFAAGYARKIDDKLTVGGRAKLLFGYSNIWTKGNSKATLHVADSSYDLTAKSYFHINSSIPQHWYEDEADLPTTFSIKNYLINTDNRGLAFDFGAQYKFSDKLTLSASVLDLGMIRWKSDVRNFRNLDKTTSFTFKGIDINEFFNKSDSAIGERLEKMLDSIANIFNITETEKAYNAPLNSIAKIGVVYNMSPKDRLGLLIHGDFFNRTVHPAFTLSYNRKLGQMVDIATTYSINNRSWLDLGVGVSLNLGALQIYAIGDNALGFLINDKYIFSNDNGGSSSFVFPAYSRNTNIHIGMNLVFGYRKVVNVPMLNE